MEEVHKTVKYTEELCKAMRMLAEHPRVIFLGQSVAYGGTAMHKTFEGIDKAKLLEMPVAEDMQMGMATGMSLNGDLPICIYPRWNFLLLATNQLVLHLDKLCMYSRGGFKPKVLIRTAVGTETPLNPGVQHLGDYSNAFRAMLATVNVAQLDKASDIMPMYQWAMMREGSTILVERMASYD